MTEKVLTKSELVTILFFLNLIISFLGGFIYMLGRFTDMGVLLLQERRTAADLRNVALLCSDLVRKLFHITGNVYNVEPSRSTDLRKQRRVGGPSFAYCRRA